MNLHESGHMQGVGAIHRDEIKPTLEKLEQALGVNLQNHVLGSVGKREFSGDIDIAIDASPEDIADFVEKLKKMPEVEQVAKSSVIMTKTRIEGYDSSKQGPQPRTGYVQVDFMPGDPDWLKTFYHAPREEDSQYKGVFRNLLLSSIAAFMPKETSDETTEDGRPIETIRWIWSSKSGLAKVKTEPVPKKSGEGYTKQHKNTAVESIKDPAKIVEVLELDSANDLYSYENLKSAIEKNYPKSKVKKILADFANNPIVKDVGVPDELNDMVQEGSEDWFRALMERVSL